MADGVEGWEVWLSGTEREREEILASIALAFYPSGLDGCLKDTAKEGFRKIPLHGGSND